MEIELGSNEFTDNDDNIGIFNTQAEPFNFLSIEKVSKELRPSKSDTSDFKISIVLSDIKRADERSAYTIMMLIGDVGGFNGAALLLPAFLMSPYSARMYKWAISSEVPVKRKCKRSNKSN